MNDMDVIKAAETALRMIKEAAGAPPPPNGPPPMAPTSNTYGSPVGAPATPAIPSGSDPVLQTGLPSAGDAARAALAYIRNRKTANTPPAAK